MEEEFDVANGARRYSPAQASRFVGHAAAELQPGDRAVVIARVSHCTQTVPLRQLADLYAGAKQLGLVVVGALARVASGWHQQWLRPAVESAIQHDAVLLALYVDRLVRNPTYHTAGTLPTESDFMRLRDATAPARLRTLFPPDTLDGVVRGDQTERGMRGRYTKSECRTGLEPLVHEVSTHGHGVRAIAKLTRLPPATVSDWLKRPDFSVQFQRALERWRAGECWNWPTKLGVLREWRAEPGGREVTIRSVGIPSGSAPDEPRVIRCHTGARLSFDASVSSSTWGCCWPGPRPA